MICKVVVLVVVDLWLGPACLGVGYEYHVRSMIDTYHTDRDSVHIVQELLPEYIHTGTAEVHLLACIMHVCMYAACSCK